MSGTPPLDRYSQRFYDPMPMRTAEPEPRKYLATVHLTLQQSSDCEARDCAFLRHRYCCAIRNPMRMAENKLQAVA